MLWASPNRASMYVATPASRKFAKSLLVARSIDLDGRQSAARL